MKDVVVVFGLGPAGLFLARILSRAGCIVVGVARADDIGRYSNCVNELIVSTDSDEILTALGGLALRYPNSIEGQIASDQYLTMILSRRSEFEKFLPFNSPDLNTLEVLNDKGAAHFLMKRARLCVPLKMLLDAADDCLSLSLPVVIKPRTKRLGKTSKVVEKIAIAKTREELEAIEEELERTGENLSDFTCEEMIPGDNFFEIGYGGYAEKGCMKIDIAVRQIKQYPQGVACVAAEIADEKTTEKVRASVVSLICMLNYTGFIQFDIKEDPETGTFYVLDVNPRVWGSVGMLARKFDHLERIFRNDNEPPCKRDELLYWRSPLKEFLVRDGCNFGCLTPPRNTNGTGGYLICMIGRTWLHFLANLRSGCRSCCAREGCADDDRIPKSTSCYFCLEAA